MGGPMDGVIEMENMFWALYHVIGVMRGNLYHGVYCLHSETMKDPPLDYTIISIAHRGYFDNDVEPVLLPQNLLQTKVICFAQNL